MFKKIKKFAFNKSLDLICAKAVRRYNRQAKKDTNKAKKNKVVNKNTINTIVAQNPVLTNHSGSTINKIKSIEDLINSKMDFYDPTENISSKFIRLYNVESYPEGYEELIALAHGQELIVTTDDNVFIPGVLESPNGNRYGIMQIEDVKEANLYYVNFVYKKLDEFEWKIIGIALLSTHLDDADLYAERLDNSDPELLSDDDFLAMTGIIYSIMETEK